MIEYDYELTNDTLFNHNNFEQIAFRTVYVFQKGFLKGFIFSLIFSFNLFSIFFLFVWCFAKSLTDIKEQRKANLLFIIPTK